MQQVLKLEILKATLAVLLITTGVIITALWRRLRKQSKSLLHKRIPPGPRGLPIVGNVHQMLKNPNKKLSEWATRYGKIFTIRLATQPTIIISDPHLLKEIFSQFASTGKFITDTFLIAARGQHGIINSEGKAWSEQRQFCVKSLKNFGFGNRSLEPLMLDEVDELVTWISRESGKSPNNSVKLGHVLQIAAINTLWTIVAGERISLDNTEMATLMSDFLKSFLFTMKSGLVYFPWLKHVAPGASGYNDLIRATDNLHEYIEACFDQHEKSFPGGQPRDLIDCYNEHLKMVKDPRSMFFGKVGRSNAVTSVLEVFIAGGETMANTLNCLIFYLSQHPTVQDKLHKEIIEVIGTNRNPSLEDRHRMPFMEAVILETLRYSSLVPLGTIYKLLEDIHYDKYTLPKGYLLIGNLYHVHHNKEIWGDPENFRPERFLQEGSDQLRKCLVPFHCGKRRCLGEFLAMEILFMFSAKLLQIFQIFPEASVPPRHYMEPEVSYLLLPKAVSVVMKARV